MDSLTHAILGAAVAEAAIGRKEGNKSIFLGAIIGTVPDLDVFVAYFFNPVKSLLAHRGFSHSILFVLLLSPLFGLIMNSIYKKSASSLNQWIFVAFLVLSTHVLMDLFTTYGTGLFEPFSHYRVEWSVLAIIDLFYTVPLFISILLLMFFKRSSKVRRIICAIGLIVSTFYLIFTVANKYHVHQKFKDQLLEQHIVFEEIKTAPLPLTNFLWMGIASHSDSYSVGLYSLFDKPGKISFDDVKRNEYLIAHLLKDKRIKDLIRFSRGYYSVGIDNGELVFNDIRFGKLGLEKNAPYIFSFVIRHDGEKLEIRQATMPGSISNDVFRKYFRRIFGDESIDAGTSIFQ